MGVNALKLQCLWLDMYQRYVSSLFYCGTVKRQDGYEAAASVYFTGQGSPSCKEKLDRDVNAAINILINATGGTPGIHACGDCVRPAGFSGGLRSLKQETAHFSKR